jgi:uroporphyrin-3 C-methyltransferase
VNADESEQKAAESFNTSSAPSADKLESTVSSPASGSSFSVLLVWTALLLAAIAVLVASWMWWQGRQAQQALQAQTGQWQTQLQQQQDELKKLEAALAAVKSSASQQSTAVSDDLQQRLQMLEAAAESAGQASNDFRAESSAWNRSAQAALEDTQARLNAVDERLRGVAARSADADAELELEEIDYLLRMAQERLQLFGDSRNADRALQLADQQVLAFDNPMFIALRREIAAARQALAATDQVDMVALGAELDSLQDSLANLPFRISGAESVPSSSATNVTGAESPWWDKLKKTLSGLVTVRRVDEAELAMPALADQQALRQRAWLQMEQARLAALSREQTLYQDSLSGAQATISRWFASEDPQVQQTLSSLKALQLRHVDPPMPDISGPWTTLQSLRNAGLSPTASPPDTAPVTSPASAPPETAVESPPEEQPVLPPESQSEVLPEEQPEAQQEAQQENRQ